MATHSRVLMPVVSHSQKPAEVPDRGMQVDGAVRGVAMQVEGHGETR
jgi:hypothetical protein